MPLTPEERSALDERFELLESKLKKALRSNRIDHRIPLLATGFDIEDALFSPTARVYNSTSITISNNTNTALTFDTERFDTDSIHSTTTNPGRLTATTAGKYLIVAMVEWQGNTVGRRSLQIRLNGAAIIGTTLITITGGTTDRQQAMALWDMVATDYVEAMAFQDRGGGLDVNFAADYSPEFMMVWVAP